MKQPLEKFKYDSAKKFIFTLTNEQFKLIEDKLQVFGDTTEGKSQVIKRLGEGLLLWRNPILLR